MFLGLCPIDHPMSYAYESLEAKDVSSDLLTVLVIANAILALPALRYSLFIG